MLAILFGQIIGLLRGIVVANAFGASSELDAFFAANRVSETLFLLVAGGALGSAFIPTFTGLLATSKREAAWRLASGIGSSLTVFLTILSLIAAWLAPQIVRYALAPGLSRDPELFELTISLLRIQLISVVLFGVGGLIVGILNAQQVFLIPALTPAMYQLGIIFGAVVLAPHLGVHGLAWGVVIGAALYLLLQIPVLIRKAGKYEVTLGLGDPTVRRVISLMGPRLLGVAVVQLNFWVNTWLASQMSPGSVTAIYYAFSLMLMAQTVVAQSVAIAAMPTFSAQFALGKIDEMRASLAASLRGVILMGVPATLGLILLRSPLISLLYERGEFDERAVTMVSWALLWYAVGLLGHSIMEVLTRAFYARQDTRTPVLIGSAAMLLNVLLSVLLSALFQGRGLLPHGGLALANSIATALEAAGLFVVLRKRLDGVHGREVGGALGAAAIAGTVMGIALRLYLSAPKDSGAWTIVLGGVGIGVVLYLAVLWILRIPEARIVAAWLAGRFSRRAA